MAGTHNGAGTPGWSDGLHHVDGGVTATYVRHSYDGEKKEAMEVWGGEA